MKSKQKTKVLIGLSGGVDSAVAALLLQEKGCQVIGAFMKNFSDTKNKFTGDCNYLQDLSDARKIAAKLKIPLKVLDFEKEYKNQVIQPMFKAYEKSLTPNPDSLCNKIIKFPLLWKEAEKLNCDYIATGHYIKKVKNNLKIPKDKEKDQSYFLYDLTQFDLSHTIFPIGESDLTKTEVRKIAKKHNLIVHDKRSTRGICFVGKIDFKEFLSQKIKPKPGKVLSPEKKVIGTHKGTMFYTVGERAKTSSGFEIKKEYTNKTKNKLYIASKNSKTNTITIAPENHPALYKKQFKIIKINFINKKPRFPLSCKVRIRHTGKLISANITKKSSKYLCSLKKPVKGLAEGQSCVLYKNSIVLGGGEIRNS